MMRSPLVKCILNLSASILFQGLKLEARLQPKLCQAVHAAQMPDYLFKISGGHTVQHPLTVFPVFP